MTHKPLRRYVVFIPFLCYFAARFTLNIKEINFAKYFEILKKKKFFSPMRMLMTFFLSLPLLILLSPSLAMLMKNFGSRIKIGNLDLIFAKIHISNFQVLSVLGIYLLCYLGIYLISYVGARHASPSDTACRVPTLMRAFSFKLQPHIVITVFLVVTISLYVLHFSNPTFTLRDKSRELGEIFNDNTLVIGGVADSLCLENKARTAHIWESPQGKILNENIVTNNQANYLLSLKKAGDIFIPETELSSKLKLLYINTLRLCPTKDQRNYRIEIEFSKIIKNP